MMKIKDIKPPMFEVLADDFQAIINEYQLRQLQADIASGEVAYNPVEDVIIVNDIDAGKAAFIDMYGNLSGSLPSLSIINELAFKRLQEGNKRRKEDEKNTRHKNKRDET